MLKSVIKKVCSIIKFIDTIGLFIILATLFISSFFFESDIEQIISGIMGCIIFVIFSTYRIALNGLNKLLTPVKLRLIILNTIILILQILFLTFFGFNPNYGAWRVFVGFFGNIYCLYFIIVTIRDIGRDLASLEKKREVKLEEYIGLSLALLPYIFAIPTIHSRIQRAILENEEKEI